MSKFDNQKYLKIAESSFSDTIDSINSLYLFIGISAIASWFVFNITVTLILSLLFVDVLISKWMARSGPPGLGLETASLATIIAGFEISPTIGGLVGALSIIFRMGVGLSGAFILWKLPGFTILGILSGTLIKNILPQALMVLIAMRICFLLSSNFLENTGLGSKISFSLTNVAIVYFMSLRISQYGIV